MDFKQALKDKAIYLELQIFTGCLTHWRLWLRYRIRKPLPRSLGSATTLQSAFDHDLPWNRYDESDLCQTLFSIVVLHTSSLKYQQSGKSILVKVGSQEKLFSAEPACEENVSVH